MVKKAVLCGINQYPTQTQLRGCVNDVNNLFDLLQSFEFPPENIHRLTDAQVTKNAIKEEYKWLISNAQTGDQLVFHFSGHGSYVPDKEGDEVDGTDEILCLYDMDFYNAQTYLRDDEWNEMIGEVPDGVDLTIIFDCCHSGTGTRAINVNLRGHQQTLFVDTETAKQRGLTTPDPMSRSANTSTSIEPSEYDALIHESSVILPRFITPPREFQERLMTAARTRSLRIKTPPIQKHLFLAGCRDDQTSADAYIERDFHGAFTYYFCQTLREKPNLGSQETIQLVRQTLRENGFSQQPQHEGKTRSNSLFLASPEPKVTITIPQPHPQNMTNLTPDNQKLLIEAYMKLLDTLSVSTPSTVETKAITPRRVSDRYLVYVHGISTHFPGYSNDWWNALKPYASSIFGKGELEDTRWEVLWSDLVNRQARALVETPEEEKLRQQINFILEEREKQMIAEATGGGQAARQVTPLVTERGGGFSWDDFIIYMTNASMRQRIIDRFTKVVQPLLLDGAEIDIISHSWGTVVAYEGLRELEQMSFSGRINSFFTVGSALSIGPVQGSLRQENKDGRRPRFVDRWINLDAKGDFVGGVLGDKFEVDQEFLKLDPVGCRRSFLGTYNLSCAHSSYFAQDNTVTNRDIFARFIEA